MQDESQDMAQAAKPFWSWQGLFVICLGVMGLLQVVMVFIFEMNWDEFLMLDWVYDWKEGKTTLPFQTIYLRSFSWLPLISDSEITQIITARLVMLMCLSVICASLYCLSRRFFSVPAALFAVIAYLAFSFIFRHAASFRMDTIVTSILMPVLFFVTAPNLKKRHIIFCGIAIGLAGMINIKAVFYIPTIGVILLSRWVLGSWTRRALFEGLAISAISAASFAGFYFYNLSSFSTSQSGSNYVSSVVNVSLLESGFFPSLVYFLISLKQNLAYWILLIIGIFFSLRFLISKDDRRNGIILLSFALPLFTLTFYLHGFPYYYTFMLAPVSVLIACAFDGLRHSKRMIYIIALCLIMAYSSGVTAMRSLGQTNDYQTQIVETVHKIFPEPVNFIDRSGMISSYNQTWFLMASWTMQDYYKNANPDVKTILTEDQPVFIVANLPSLDLDRLSNKKIPKRLLPQDEALLKEHYIHHWGPIYVPGKILKASQKPATFDILIAGTYTHEANSSVNIDGIDYQPGAHIELDQGVHSVTASENSDVIIRYGKNLYRPDYEPSGKLVFRGF